jgi:hypothetical protein
MVIKSELTVFDMLWSQSAKMSLNTVYEANGDKRNLKELQNIKK